MSVTVAVLCVMGGTTLKPQDVHGEAALLLDTIDLVLHSAAVASATPAAGAAAAAITNMPDSDQMILDDPSSSVHDRQQQPACPHENSSDKFGPARQPASQIQGYGESLLWGLRAIAAMAKQGGLVQDCAHMLTEYVLERIMLLSRDWPVEVGQAAAAVSMIITLESLNQYCSMTEAVLGGRRHRGRYKASCQGMTAAWTSMGPVLHPRFSFPLMLYQKNCWWA